MALGHHQKSPQLLDMLIQMNDLVQTLQKSDMGQIIKNLKNESENLKQEQARADTAKLQAEMAINAAKKAEQDAAQATEVIKQETAQQELRRIEAEKSVKKLQNETLALETAKKLHDKNVLELEEKIQAVAKREAKALEAEKIANGLKIEYEKKLEYFRKAPV